MPTLRVVPHVQVHAEPPAHHLMSTEQFRGPELVGFQNPWDSWHKPSAYEVVQGLEWGERPGTDAHNARPNLSAAVRGVFSPRSESPDLKSQAERKKALPLQVQKPDFGFDKERAKATWLGHAGALLQLPSLSGDGRPLTVLFDPIFSARCSPSQLVGPLRFFPAPCAVADLPEIDIVVISHNHYDHLDYHTIVSLWERFGTNVHFVVPLGNKAWFIHETVDIAPDSVTELDWWDEATVETEGSGDLRIVCTPAQHGSGRTTSDAGHTLWSSWMLEHTSASDPEDVYRVFFGGDSGFRFRVGTDECCESPEAMDEKGDAGSVDESAVSTPTQADSPLAASTPSPTDMRPRLSSDSHKGIPFLEKHKIPHITKVRTMSESSVRDVSPFRRRRSEDKATVYPACPAFAEIAAKLGAPDMLMLPVSVGATYAFLKSFDLLPDWISPIPRLSDGLTGANHMSASDAVAILQIMQTQGRSNGRPPRHRPVCLAIHWGTFVEGPAEITETIFRLETACAQRRVAFVRAYEGVPDAPDSTPAFALVNHGQSIRVVAD